MVSPARAAREIGRSLRETAGQRLSQRLRAAGAMSKRTGRGGGRSSRPPPQVPGEGGEARNLNLVPGWSSVVRWGSASFFIFRNSRDRRADRPEARKTLVQYATGDGAARGRQARRAHFSERL